MNLWRVATRHPTSPAHLVSIATAADGVRVMACGWIPTAPGLVITHEDMVAAQRFACIRCMTVAKAVRP